MIDQKTSGFEGVYNVLNMACQSADITDIVF